MKNLRLIRLVTILSFASSLFALPVIAADYPNMVGTGKGHIRVVSSGSSLDDQVAQGGAVLSEIDLKLTINHQDGETFIGKTRASTTPKSQPSGKPLVS